MTETDKIEIANLVNAMNDMAKYNKKMDEKFVDENISAFATEAKNDYVANHNYILDVIRNNISIFFNLNHLEVTTSGSSTEGYRAMRGDVFSCPIGNGLRVNARLIDFDTIENTGYHITFNVRKMEIYKVWFYISDTDDKRYHTCSDWDLFTHDMGDFNLPRTAKDWNVVYVRATCTREKNVLLIKEFKQLMTNKIAQFRLSANEKEKVRELNSKICAYVKVDL